MQKEIKLIAFDLDGTFLDDDKRVPEKNIQAVKAAAARGIICLPATGRLASGIPRPVFDLPGMRYILTSNGAAVYDLETRRVLYRAVLEPDTALRLCDYMQARSVTYTFLQFERGYMSRDMHGRVPEYFSNPAMAEYMQQVYRPVDDLRGLVEKRAQPLEKMLMFFKPEEQQLRAEQLELMPKLFPELKISSSISNNIEINAHNADKGQAISALCDHLGIALENIVCFGDASNDITMLKAAGLGIAMSNGVDSARAAADMCTDSDNNHGGVGEMIMKLIG